MYAITQKSLLNSRVWYPPAWVKVGTNFGWDKREAAEIIPEAEDGREGYDAASFWAAEDGWEDAGILGEEVGLMRTETELSWEAGGLTLTTVLILVTELKAAALI